MKEEIKEEIKEETIENSCDEKKEVANEEKKEEKSEEKKDTIQLEVLNTMPVAPVVKETKITGFNDFLKRNHLV